MNEEINVFILDNNREIGRMIGEEIDSYFMCACRQRLKAYCNELDCHKHLERQGEEGG